MLSKTELLPAKDRLKDADRHLAYVKLSAKHIKSVENKQIVNDLVGAIEAQRKAVEQMLQVLDTVARHDFHHGNAEGAPRVGSHSRNGRETIKRRLRGELGGPGYLDVPKDQPLAPLEPV